MQSKDWTSELLKGIVVIWYTVYQSSNPSTKIVKCTIYLQTIQQWNKRTNVPTEIEGYELFSVLEQKNN